MESILRNSWSTVQALFGRVSSVLEGTSSEAFHVTATVGLAALVYGLYYLRQDVNQGRQEHELRPAEKFPTTAKEAMSPLESAVQFRLQGVRRVTISCPHVLLHQHDPEQLQYCAELRGDVATILRLACLKAEVFLLAHVQDDIGEATVRGALEAAGALGNQKGQVPAHRLLFCGTSDGKKSIVRQLEPDIHMDSVDSTVAELCRFIPRVVQVPEPAASGVTSANVEIVQSLHVYFTPQPVTS